jgi:parvulin-like peptidyl-prolyl isomerase
MKDGLKLLGCLVPLAVLVAAWPYARADAAPDPNAAAEGLNAAAAVVTINGLDITEGQVRAAVRAEFEKMAKQQSHMPPTSVVELTKQFRQQVVRRMILGQLFQQQADAEKIKLTEEDVIDHLKARGARQNPPLSLEQIKQQIKAKGETFDQTVKRIQQSKQLRFQKLVNTHVADKIETAEQDANDYYTMNRQQFETPGQVRTSHILIKTADTDRAKAKAKAQRLLKRIKAGADFAKLAKANSDDSYSAAKGGDLGFAPKGIWDEPFERVAFGLQAGQVSDVVETTSGYHLIKVTGRIAPTAISFEEAKESIMEHLTEQKRRRVVTEYINSLKKRANIVYHDDTFPLRRKIIVRPTDHDHNHAMDEPPPE